MRERRRIGLMGGSFNPVHIGHMMLAQYLVEFGGLDSVWLLLSGQNPLKDPTTDVTDIQRMEMLEIACDASPRLEASAFELRLPRPSYTYNTLTALREAFPDVNFTLLIGADNWAIFNRWRNADKIISQFDIIIYPRRGFDINPAALPSRTTYCSSAPIIEVSSTFLREAISEGHCVNQFLPAGVYDYITTHQLYVNRKPDSKP